MGTRRQGREFALQLLYQWDLRRDDLGALGLAFWESHDAGADVRLFADDLVRGVVAHLEAIDGLIERHARRWRLERMEAVDRNLLRLAAEELLHHEDTPPSVVINEAIEISRRYSTAESPQFVNGLLDSMWKEIGAEGRGRKPASPPDGNGATGTGSTGEAQEDRSARD